MDSIKKLTNLLQEKHAPAFVKKNTSHIYWQTIRHSRRIASGNFNRLEEKDLENLFEAYDGIFFQGLIKHSLKKLGHPLSFRLSGKMTRAGGKTTRQESFRGKRLISREYEIAISTTLLFQTFRDGKGGASVTGVRCSDRLQALQRIFEHELVHLVEMMGWYHSDCFRKRFKVIATRLFLHSESTHQLTTVDERAFSEFGIKVGDQVRFRHENSTVSGFVNRITKRATVLVESPKGELFSDGKRYAKFYVPIPELIPASRSA